MPVVKADELRQLGISILEKAGASTEKARIVSDYMVDSHLYGHETHGVISIPRFVKDIRVGKINLAAKMEIVRQSGGTALIDGHWDFGYVTATKAMETAIEMAGSQGTSAIAVRNCNHIGMLWGYAKMAVDRGLIGIVVCSSGPQGGLVAPYGGTRRFLGANPMAFGLPAGERRPLIADISTSIVAGGKVLLASEKGESIPEGWVLDEHGSPTTDPMALLERGGALLPFGRHKGYALALLVEMLGGVLTGYGPAYLTDYREGNGTFMIVIDVGRFIPLEVFRKQADDLFRAIKRVPTDADTEEILVPGELEFRTREIREREGISIPERTWKRVVDLGVELGLNVAGNYSPLRHGEHRQGKEGGLDETKGKTL